LSNGIYYNTSYKYDSDSARASTNHFTASTCNGNQVLTTGILGDGHKFYCSQAITVTDPAASPGTNCATGTCKIILARVRFLYINENHSLAFAPNNGQQFPPQVQIYNSIGTSGQSQKQVQAFKERDVVPPWFDFAVFSVNEIRK